MLYCHIILTILISIWSGCIFQQDSTENTDKNKYTGFTFISSKGESFYQGSDGRYASEAEKPPMMVNFKYDYWIQTNEVTQEQFLNFMKSSPVTEETIFGYGPDRPVYFVSWYDAVLFCNAMSKSMNLDTIYEYIRLDKSASGSVY